MASDFQLICDGFRPVLIEAVDAHAKGFCPACDLLPDASKADDADAFAENFAASDAVPAPGARAVDGEGEIFCHRKDQQKRVFRDGVVVDTGSEQDGDFEFLGRWDVDFVEANAILGDDFQARQGFLDDRASDGVIATEKCVEIPGKFQHARFRERSALADDVPALGGHESVVRTRGVLITAGGE